MGPDTDPRDWTEQEEAFQRIKELSTEVPTLGGPYLDKPFPLCAAEKQGVTRCADSESESTSTTSGLPF